MNGGKLKYNSQNLNRIVIKNLCVEPITLYNIVLSLMFESCNDITVYYQLDLSFRFPTYRKPYLSCIHSSNVTCSTHVVNCPTELWNYIEEAGRKYGSNDPTNKVEKCLGISWRYSVFPTPQYYVYDILFYVILYRILHIYCFAKIYSILCGIWTHDTRTYVPMLSQLI